MSELITVQINYFGPYLTKEDIPKILNPMLANTILEHQSDLLNSFFGLPISALSLEILERYVEVTDNGLHTAVVPHTAEILERLLKPLRSAKRSYSLGDYVATIALCGIVGEMLAILLWKINDVRLKGSQITEKEEKSLFGRTFEMLGQEKKIEILKTFGHIDDMHYQLFKDVKDSRRPYLHLWTADFTKEKEDAMDVFQKTFQLFKDVTGIGLADAGTVRVNPLLMKLFNN